jgi:hypothetical protein
MNDRSLSVSACVETCRLQYANEGDRLIALAVPV